MSNVRLMSYFSVLLFSGMLSGILIGVVAFPGHGKAASPKDMSPPI